MTPTNREAITGSDRRPEDQVTRQRERIIDAAGIDPAGLNHRGRRILDWLADQGTPTVDGVVELVTAARLGGYVAAHHDQITAKNQALADSETRLNAAFARYDAKHSAGADKGGVEL